MKPQQINVYARFISEDAPAPETARTGEAKARRASRRAGSDGARSPKQGLKKQAGLPK